MLLSGSFRDLVFQHGKGADEFFPRFFGCDYLINKTPCRGQVGRGEFLRVFLRGHQEIVGEETEREVGEDVCDHRRANRPSNQPLNLLRTSVDLPLRNIPLLSRQRRVRQHRIL